MNRLKIHVVIYLFTCMLFLNAYAQDAWIRQDSPTSVFLRKCTFADSLNGWIIGDSGVILYTSNGGANWIIQNQNVNHYLVNIFFLDKYNGWIAAWYNNFNNGSIIYRTTNGGHNWNYSNFPDSNLFISSIYFLDNNNGYFGTLFPNGNIYRTTNGGGDWSPCSIDSSAFSHYAIREIEFYNQLTGFCIGGYIDIAGVIWRTTNAGISWTPQAVGAEPINDIEFLDSMNFIAVGGDYEYGPSIVKTTDAGVSWNYQTLNEFGIAYALSFRTDLEAWIPLGFSQNLLLTTDRGTTWSLKQAPDSSALYYTTFTDNRNGWMIGEEGKIYKFNPNSSNIISNQTLIPKSIYLYQNYPNPFNPTTTIKYGIPQNGLVKLVVYDLLGKEVATLVNDEQSAGYYEVTFDASKLTSGVYFYKITSGDFSDVKKMLLVK